MPLTAPAREANPLLDGEQPCTLTTLQAEADVTFLDGGLDTVGLIGTQLSDALISTNNGAALLSGMGGLSRFQDSTRPFHISRNRLTFRAYTQTPVQLVRTRGRAGAGNVVAVLDARENVTLRIEANGGYDGRVLAAVDSGDRMELAKDEDTIGHNVIALGAVRQARETWSRSDSGQHLNDMLRSGGQSRAFVLPHVGCGRAWQIQEQVLVSFLTYLVDRNISHGRLVAGNGFLQGDLHTNGSIQLLDQILLVSGQRQHFALDLSQIEACWVTRFGTVSHLEFYTSDQKAVAVLAPDPHGDVGRWNDLLASLPIKNGSH